MNSRESLQDKEYYFFRDQLYDFMYTEDQDEIDNYVNYSINHKWPNLPTKQARKLRNTERFLKFFIFLIIALLIMSPFTMPLFGIYVAVAFMVWGFGSLFATFLSFNNEKISIKNTKNKRVMWLQSPTFLWIFPSLLKITLTTTAWLHDMVAAIPRLKRYYSRKGTENATFEDSIKRGGAWGSLIGSFCTIGAAVVVGVLLFNPYTLFGAVSIAATVGLFLFMAPRIVKCFELVGRLVGIFYTKKQVERALELQLIFNKKQRKDSRPTCTIAFVNTLPSNDELTKMKKNGIEIPHYYYCREENDSPLNWRCYSVTYLPSGKVEANLKPCYAVKAEQKSCDTVEPINKEMEDINKDFRETLKLRTEIIYNKYMKKKSLYYSP